jgi:dipeptidyl aminopeptidase/acylaminoacyl peptidase
MRPEHIASVVAPNDPRLSPDLTQVAFSVHWADAEANTGRSAVWVATIDGQRTDVVATNASMPRWSPDGRSLAFVRESSVCVLPMRGPGEARTIATWKGSAPEALEWSPDGTYLATLARIDAHHDTKDADRPPRRITRLFSRLDDVGWIVDRPMHVFIVRADGTDASPRDLTPGGRDHGSISWLRDASALVSVRLTPDFDTTQQTELVTVPLDGDEPVAFGPTDRSLEAAVVSPDGLRVASVGFDRPTDQPRHARLTLTNRRSGDTTEIDIGIDRTVSAAVWGSDDRLVFSVVDRGAVRLLRVALDGSVADVAGGDRTVSAFDARGDTVVFVASTPTRPGEVVVSRDGQERQLTSFAPRLPFTPVDATKHTVRDELDVWTMWPAGVEPLSAPPASVPLLLFVHGGPMSQYGFTFLDEFQIAAGSGFAVAFSNPRGSNSGSEESMRALRSPLAEIDPGRGWGADDIDDVLAALDDVLQRFPCIDSTRVGILGGSYGGYVTSWMLTHHGDRFAAGCSERSANNLLSLEQSSDVAGFFRFEIGVSHLDHPDEYLRMSPISSVAHLSKPMLMLHSEHDLRCPIDQAEQWFVACRILGLDHLIEFHRFPAESHELSRSGSPTHRRVRAEIIDAFFRKHLMAETDAAAPGAAQSHT